MSVGDWIYEPCPYCEDGEVAIDPETLDGVCPECDALVSL